MPSFVLGGKVLYLIICAAPPAQAVDVLIKRKQRDGWNVCVTATPSALDWVDTKALETLTGHEVRAKFRRPGATAFTPLGSAVVVSPATFNTINKFAAGISDTLALGLLNEALGRNVPIEIQPYVNDALATHPAYRASVDLLSSAGARFAPIEYY